MSCHFVRFARGAGAASHVEEEGGREAVVEHRVRDQATRVVWFARGGVCDKRVAVVGSLELGFGPDRARKLLLVERLNIATVVLVKVGKAIVEKDWRIHLGRERELEGAYFRG